MLWFVLALGLLAAALLVGNWREFAIMYFVCGIMWVRHDLRRPPLRRRMAYRISRGEVLGWVIWPLFALFAAREWWNDLRERDERFFRFTVSWGQIGQNHDLNFKKWSEALDFARGKARELSEDVTLSDSGRYQFSKLEGDWTGTMYRVHPSGRIERITL